MNVKNLVFIGASALSLGIGLGMSGSVYADYDCLTTCRQDRIECNSDCGFSYPVGSVLFNACINRCQSAFQACAQGCQ